MQLRRRQTASGGLDCKLRRGLLGLLLTGLCACGGLVTRPTAIEDVEIREKPRLILQITVDQLRGDLPLRHLEQFGEGG